MGIGIRIWVTPLPDKRKCNWTIWRKAESTNILVSGHEWKYIVWDWNILCLHIFKLFSWTMMKILQLRFWMNFTAQSCLSLPQCSCANGTQAASSEGVLGPRGLLDTRGHWFPCPGAHLHCPGRSIQICTSYSTLLAKVQMDTIGGSKLGRGLGYWWYGCHYYHLLSAFNLPHLHCLRSSPSLLSAARTCLLHTHTPLVFCAFCNSHKVLCTTGAQVLVVEQAIRIGPSDSTAPSCVCIIHV